MATRLKLAIVTSGLHQYEVADKAGIHESLLSMYVRGRRKIPKNHLRKLSRILGIAQKDLLK